MENHTEQLYNKHYNYLYDITHKEVNLYYFMADLEVLWKKQGSPRIQPLILPLATLEGVSSNYSESLRYELSID